MLGIAAEFEHVPLGDAEVFEQFPGGVRRAFGANSMQSGREVGDGLIEIGMRAAPFEELHELVA